MSVATESVAGLGLGVTRHTIAGRGMICIQPRAGVVFDPGAAVVHRDGVQLGEIPLSTAPRTDLVSLGRFVAEARFTASSTADAAGGAVDSTTLAPQQITVEPWSEVGTGWFATGTGANLIAEANIDQPCFWYDDGTLYLTDLGGTLSYAGAVAAVDPLTSRVALKSGELWRAMYVLLSAGETAGASVTSDGTARIVATNIPTGTFAAGVFTVTATGAFPTQDGLAGPLSVGDVIVFPTGTITTMAVTAANSGPYEVTTVGATGVQAVFTRPAKWAHAATIKPETTIKIGGEGTLFANTVWRARPLTNALVVGTGDPVLVPDKVVQSVSLGGGSPLGTVTISNVPLGPTGSSGIAITRTTATTSTLTVGGYATTTFTGGGIGTASVVIIAAVGAGTINTADGSTLRVTLFN